MFRHGFWRMSPVLLLALAAAAGSPEKKVRFLLPRNPFLRAADHALQDTVDQFNRSPQAIRSGIRVELQQKGDGYSSLKDLVALRMAGDAPEIAAIEASEAPALAALGLA